MTLRYSMYLAVLLILLGLLAVPASGKAYIFDGSEENALDVSWDNFLDTLPDNIREDISFLQPDKPDSWQKFLTFSYWKDKLKTLFHEGFQQATGSLTAIFGILLLISAVQQWNHGTTGTVFAFCSDVCMALTLFGTSQTIIGLIRKFLEQLCFVMSGMIPVMSAICYGAGEAATASVNRIAMTLFITVLNTLQRGLFMPLGQVLFCISILGAVCTQIPLGSFTASVKKLFMTLFSFMLLIYSFVYGIQNTLARSADSIGLRSVKFAIGNLIPVVGSTVSDAFSAVREGLGYVRTMTGIGGILVLFLMLLPVMMAVWSFDLVLSCGHTAAELLGCVQSARMLADTRSVLQLLSALAWLAVVFFLFAIILFTKTAVHAG